MLAKPASWKEEILSHKKVILISIMFLLLANVLNYYASTYADEAADVEVSDLILSHIPVINLGFLFVYGYLFILSILFLYPLLFKVKKLHVVISQFSLLIVIRSFFLTLTHLKLPHEAIAASFTKGYLILSFTNDMFFSGHTAMPFLGYLLFRERKIGKFFLLGTFIMALTVLFMHYHYSIDVFAAICITYSSFKIGEWLFKRIDEDETISFK